MTVSLPTPGVTSAWGTMLNAAMNALDAAITSLGTSKSDVGHTHTQSYSLLPPGQLLCVDYTTTPPARPSSRTDIYFRWRGQVVPTAALAGDEYVPTA